jgi:hypothetical protein
MDRSDAGHQGSRRPPDQEPGRLAVSVHEQHGHANAQGNHQQTRATADATEIGEAPSTSSAISDALAVGTTPAADATKSTRGGNHHLIEEEKHPRHEQGTAKKKCQKILSRISVHAEGAITICSQYGHG